MAAPTEPRDSTPVPDSTFVAPLALSDLPAAPPLNTPVTSGPCVSPPSSVVTVDKPCHSKAGASASSAPTGAKTSTYDPPETDVASLSAPTTSAPSASTGVLAATL